MLVVLGLYARYGGRFARESAAGPIGTGMMLGMLGLGILWIAQIPFGLAEIWWARRHDAAEVGYVEWLVGYWLGLAGEFGFICLALAIVMGFAQVLRDRWWVAGAPTFVALYVLFAFSLPWLVVDDSPVRDPELRATARRYALEEGTTPIPVRVERVSDYTDSPNAFAAGMDASRRIFIWDTLLDGRFDDDEVHVVLAHEIAHHAREHIWKSIGWYALFAVPGTFLIALATRRRGSLAEAQAVPLALFVFVALSIAAQPLTEPRLAADGGGGGLGRARHDRGPGRRARPLPRLHALRARRPGAADVGDAPLRQPPDDPRPDPDGRGLAGSLAGPLPSLTPHPPGGGQGIGPVRGLRAESVPIRPPRCGRAAQVGAPALDADVEVAAGEVDDDLAVAVRRRRDRDGARSRRARLPHAALPDARGDLAGRVDARDLDVRPLGESADASRARGPIVGRSAGSPTTTACGLPTSTGTTSIAAVDRLLGAPTATGPRSCSTSSPPSIRATTSRSPTRRRTTSAPVRSASQRAAIRVPLPDISACEPSGFQITTAPSSATSRIPSALPTSSRTRSGVSPHGSVTR